MPAKITEEHIDLILGKIEDDLRAKFREAVESAVGDECVTSLTYKVEIDAAKPKRENKASKEPKQKKPVGTVERKYKPAPVNEKDELLTLSVAELPLLDGAGSEPAAGGDKG